jgi:hypothetical protein
MVDVDKPPRPLKECIVSDEKESQVARALPQPFRLFYWKQEPFDCLILVDCTACMLSASIPPFFLVHADIPWFV